MKRIFAILAAVLLTSVCAMAQSNDATPLKGDVNGDGMVDVADIVAVIDVMEKGDAGYFYLGTTQPTAENYASLPGVVSTYTSITEANDATINVTDGQTIYLLCPASWVEGKTVKLDDNDGNPINFSEDLETVSGYVVYTANGLSSSKTISLKVESAEAYSYYVGVTDKVSFTTSDLTQSTTTKPTTLTFAAAPAGTNNYQTFVYPSSWGKPTSMMAGGLDGKNGWFWGTDAGMESLPSGYTAGVHQGGAVTYTVTW